MLLEMLAAGGGIEPPRRVISGGSRVRCHTIRRPGIVHFWLPEQGSNLHTHSGPVLQTGCLAFGSGGM